jgi:hypothetical protein
MIQDSPREVGKRPLSVWSRVRTECRSTRAVRIFEAAGFDLSEEPFVILWQEGGVSLKRIDR